MNSPVVNAIRSNTEFFSDLKNQQNRYVFSTLSILSALVLVAFSSTKISAQLLSRDGSGVVQKSMERQESSGRLARKIQAKLKGVIRPQDEIWIVNARKFVECPTDQCQKILCDVDVAKNVGGCWIYQTMKSLLKEINSDPVRQNVVFIHGNRTDFSWAKLRGTEIYEAAVLHDKSKFTDQEYCEQEIIDLNPCNDELEVIDVPAVRWIIWAWPSDKICGPKRDLFLKQMRASEQGRLLATFFNRVIHQKISIAAYSLGAKAFASSLVNLNDEALWNIDFVKKETKKRKQILLASTQLKQNLPVSPMPKSQNLKYSKNKRFQVVMVAAAIPETWIQNSCTLAENVDHLTLINNSSDRVLKVYRKITGDRALGSVPSIGCAVVPCDLVNVHNNRIVNHFLDQYLESDLAKGTIRQGLFGIPSERVNDKRMERTFPKMKKVESDIEEVKNITNAKN